MKQNSFQKYQETSKQAKAFYLTQPPDEIGIPRGYIL
jgi:hypothetical protein